MEAIPGATGWERGPPGGSVPRGGDRHWRVRELSQRGATLEDVFVEMTHYA